MSDEVLIKIDELSRQFGNRMAVNGLSFQIKRGQITGLLGPNGAGKSTTMQMITGNLAPTAGQIEINGVDMLEHPKLAKAALGYLPEYPPLYRDQTVDEFLGFCARINHVPKAHQSESIARAKARCGLEAVARRLIGNLSKGYQQRVGIAQAIIHEPAVVILDEPTVGLDPNQIRDIRQLIRELGAQHSVLLSSHILSEVQMLCDHVHIINEGRLVYSGVLDSPVGDDTVKSYFCEFAHEPAIDILRAIPGIREVHALTPHRLRVQIDPKQNALDTLMKESLTQGWRLRELSPERVSLEQLFVQLTMSQNATEGAA